MRTRFAIAALAATLALPLAYSLLGHESRAAGPTAAKTAAEVRLVKVGSFTEPTFLAAPPGEHHRRFVTERAGRIRIVRGSTTLVRPFLDISAIVQTDGESGLLSMAFAPDYVRSRRYFVSYVDKTEAVVVDQYRASVTAPDRTQPDSRRRVLRVPHPRKQHKGGQIQFGPDGKLYVGLGDGGGSGDSNDHAQDLSSYLGKVLRIAPRPGGGYAIPGDNPFVGRDGARGEIFAYGLRNPYRFSFDRLTGDLTLADVGRNAVEEVNFVPADRRTGRPRGGPNFGWDVFEGTVLRYEGRSVPGHVPPVLERTHGLGGVCAIIGGYVIRDRSLDGRFGAYVYGDLCDPRLRVARLGQGGARDNRALGPRVNGLVSFGEDARGRVHAISLNGAVFRLAGR